MEIRKVTTRLFQQNFHRELQKLPFEITKYGETVGFVVATLEESKVIPTLTYDEVKVIDKFVVDKKHFEEEKLCELAFIENLGKCKNVAIEDYSVPEQIQLYDNGQRSDRKVSLCFKHGKDLEKVILTL